MFPYSLDVFPRCREHICIAPQELDVLGTLGRVYRGSFHLDGGGLWCDFVVAVCIMDEAKLVGVARRIHGFEHCYGSVHAVL